MENIGFTLEMQKMGLSVETEKIGVTVDVGEEKALKNLQRILDPLGKPDPNIDYRKIREERTKQWKELGCNIIEFEEKLVDLEAWQALKPNRFKGIVGMIEATEALDDRYRETTAALIQGGVNVRELLREKNPNRSQEQPTNHNCMEEERPCCSANAVKRPTSPLVAPQPLKRRKITLHDISELEKSATDPNAVVLGPNGTTVSMNALQAINWSLSDAALTRKILMLVFDRETLASHTLSGKPSPAFIECNKPVKGQLDPAKVADVLEFTTKYLEMIPKEVRNTITFKCADENKLRRKRQAKRGNMKQEGDVGRGRHSC